MTPLQMARFYALIANGGKLVTPHLLMDVENPNGAAVPLPAPPPPKDVPGVDPAALQIVRQGLLRGDAPPLRHLVSGLREVPGLDRRQDGNGREVVTLPGYVGVKNQSWWCGYGPTDNAKIVVCAVIENGGHGGTAAAPAAAQVLRDLLPRQGEASDLHPLRLMGTMS